MSDAANDLTSQIRSHPGSDGSDHGTSPPGKRPRLEEPVIESPIASPDVPDSVKTEGNKRTKQKARRGHRSLRRIDIKPYSSDDVLWHDVMTLLGKDVVDKAIAEVTDFESPLEFKSELELEVLELSSTGDGLALAPEPYRPWVVVVPFALPGEKVRARIYRNSRLRSYADLLSVEVPNPELRNPSNVKCKYFGQCSGCQYQMLPYETQLDIKRNVVIKAYQNFSSLPASSVPEVLPTIASPLQYGYRTKITPHFEAAPKRARLEPPEDKTEKPNWLKIGFNEIGRRTVVVDIEECPIATPVLNEALGPIREDIIKNIWNYKRGVSLLLRDSIETPSSAGTSAESSSDPVDALASELEKHVCVTNHKTTVRERVGDMFFEFPGGSFFQNNNSVLVPLTDYVRDAIFPSSPELALAERPTHLVDAYCGSGLFSIMLSPHFTTVAGIELSSDSIKSAVHNAQLNNIPEGKCTFRTGDAANIFAAVGEFPPERTAVIIDPPRKGCDEKFIEQLLAFKSKTVVYVSCNVHTQARDIGMILGRTVGEEGKRYVLESLRGFDLFPQTAHVESVAVLRLL